MSVLQVEPGQRPVIVTARLQQGLAWDPFFGIALDGVVASVARRAGHAGVPGSLIDGGLDTETPREWALPFGRCAAEQDWHWAVGHGVPVGVDGTPVDVTAAPDAHRIIGAVDERRAPFVTSRIPKETRRRMGRFKDRFKPVLVTPAAAVRWQAVANPNDLEALLAAVTAVGGRRGAGEGAVLGWRVDVVDVEDVFTFVHVNGDRLSRPMPPGCAERTGIGSQPVRAGIRPPYFHPAMQRDLRLAVS